MGLHDQVQDMGGSTSQHKVFKDDINYKFLHGDGVITFKYLPAFNPNDPNPATSMLPFITPEGILTDWGMILYLARWIGHGNGKDGGRMDIVSLKTFAQRGQEIKDPIVDLIHVINQLSSEWGYLLKDQSPNERAAVSKPSMHFMGNIWDANQPNAGVIIGVLPPSATFALINPKFGLVYQKSNIPDNIVKQNYLLAYQTGDLTHPVTGPALDLVRENMAQGRKSRYRIRLSSDSRGNVYTPIIGQDLLAQRYNFTNYKTFLNCPTEEDIVMQLVRVLNMRGPHGHHEYNLLKIAFPQFRIPDPPAAPAATSTIASGFAPNPALTAQASGNTIGKTAGQMQPVMPQNTVIPTNINIPPTTTVSNMQMPNTQTSNSMPSMATTINSVPPTTIPNPQNTNPTMTNTTSIPGTMQTNKINPVAPGDKIEMSDWDEAQFIENLKRIAKS